jgi:hypothetical protein
LVEPEREAWQSTRFWCPVYGRRRLVGRVAANGSLWLDCIDRPDAPEPDSASPATLWAGVVRGGGLLVPAQRWLTESLVDTLAAHLQGAAGGMSGARSPLRPTTAGLTAVDGAVAGGWHPYGETMSQCSARLRQDAGAGRGRKEYGR